MNKLDLTPVSSLVGPLAGRHMMRICAAMRVGYGGGHQARISEGFPERCRLEAETEGGRVVHAGMACAGDWRSESVGSGDDLSGAQRHLEGHGETERMEARAADWTGSHRALEALH